MIVEARLPSAAMVTEEGTYSAFEQADARSEVKGSPKLDKQMQVIGHKRRATKTPSTRRFDPLDFRQDGITNVCRRE